MSFAFQDPAALSATRSLLGVKGVLSQPKFDGPRPSVIQEHKCTVQPLN